VRYARFDASDAPADDVKEAAAADSYYLRKHLLKVQGDLRRLENEGRGTTSHELRLQTQLVF
jgi:hypothetical protein